MSVSIDCSGVNKRAVRRWRYRPGKERKHQQANGKTKDQGSGCSAPHGPAAVFSQRRPGGGWKRLLDQDPSGGKKIYLRERCCEINIQTDFSQRKQVTEVGNTHSDTHTYTPTWFVSRPPAAPTVSHTTPLSGAAISDR